MREPESLALLREEAIALAAGSPISRELVEDWRTRTLAVLERAYGQDSQHLREFSMIKFDDDAIVDSAERILRNRVADSLKIDLPSGETALRRGLHEAADLLLSLTI